MWQKLHNRWHLDWLEIPFIHWLRDSCIVWLFHELQGQAQFIVHTDLILLTIFKLLDLIFLVGIWWFFLVLIRLQTGAHGHGWDKWQDIFSVKQNIFHLLTFLGKNIWRAILVRTFLISWSRISGTGRWSSKRVARWLQRTCTYSRNGYWRY